MISVLIKDVSRKGHEVRTKNTKKKSFVFFVVSLVSCSENSLEIHRSRSTCVKDLYSCIRGIFVDGSLATSIFILWGE
jgi:hypothetical protein